MRRKTNPLSSNLVAISAICLFLSALPTCICSSSSSSSSSSTSTTKSASIDNDNNGLKYLIRKGRKNTKYNKNNNHRRQAVDLSFSEEAHTFTTLPFKMKLFETPEAQVSDEALRIIELATNKFLYAELNVAMPFRHVVSVVETLVLEQNSVQLASTQRMQSRTTGGNGGTQLFGTELTMQVTPSFRSDQNLDPPTLDQVEVATRELMQDLTYWLTNLTQSIPHPDLDHVYMAVREEIPVQEQQQEQTGGPSIIFVPPGNPDQNQSNNDQDDSNDTVDNKDQTTDASDVDDASDGGSDDASDGGDRGTSGIGNQIQAPISSSRHRSFSSLVPGLLTGFAFFIVTMFLFMAYHRRQYQVSKLEKDSFDLYLAEKKLSQSGSTSGSDNGTDPRNITDPTIYLDDHEEDDGHFNYRIHHYQRQQQQEQPKELKPTHIEEPGFPMKPTRSTPNPLEVPMPPPSLQSSSDISTSSKDSMSVEEQRKWITQQKALQQHQLLLQQYELEQRPPIPNNSTLSLRPEQQQCSTLGALKELVFDDGEEDEEQLFTDTEFSDDRSGTLL